MNNCQGALILALVRHRASTDSGVISLPSEYNHLEGGLAISRGLPILIMAEKEIEQRGIAAAMSGRLAITIPKNADERWLHSDEFASPFGSWRTLVKSRSLVYLAYSGRLLKTAQAVRQYLEFLGISVFDWSRDTLAGGVADGPDDWRFGVVCGAHISIWSG